jgi:thiol-disulfide isomerase/thioredoxin
MALTADERMTDSEQPAFPAKQRGEGGLMLYILAGLFAAIAGFGSVTIGDFLSRPSPPSLAAGNTGGYLSAASTQDGKGGMSKLVRAEAPKALPDVAFQDHTGASRSLAEWKGKVVLVNLWATWCAPCKLEMPSLDRLQAQLGGADFAVLPISLDRQGLDMPRKFLAANKLGNLPLLIDSSTGIAGKLGAIGLPATIILDREGHEIARLLGPAEWDSPDAKALIRAAIAGKVAQ